MYKIDESWKVAELEDLFRHQTNILKNNTDVFSSDIIARVARCRDGVLSKAVQEKMVVKEGYLPFLIIIPFSICSTSPGAMVHASYDLIETPRGPYFLWDVEGGLETLGKPTWEIEKLISSAGRSGLTDAELFYFAVFTSVSANHLIYALNSRCDEGRDQMHAIFQKSNGDHDSFCFVSTVPRGREEGAPSCRDRIEF